MSYSRLKMAQFGPGQTGLVGTVGYAIYNAANVIVGTRITAGITERPAGSGTYAATVTIADGQVGEIRWDTGGGTPKYASEPIDIDDPALVLTTAMTESYSADGVAPTPVQALFAILQRLTEFAISGTTLTVKKLDGSTQALVLTLNSATVPTASTRTA